MKIKENLSIRKIGDDYMMVADSELGIDYTRIISLNETAHYLLEQVQSIEFSKEDWIQLLTEKYNVSKEQAADDVQILIETLQKSGVIE